MLEPEMERHGYSKPFSSAVTAFSSIITPLIPPGIAAILYGSIANLVHRETVYRGDRSWFAVVYIDDVTLRDYL